MNLFLAVYWIAMLAEIIIRAPFDRNRRKEKMSLRRVPPQENILLAGLSFGMLVLPLVYSATPWLNWANYSLPGWASWAGVALMAGAVAVFWRAHVDLGLNWSPSLEIGEKHELITHGLYRHIRHPMYASEWLWALAQALLLPNWLAGCLGLVIFIPFYVLRVKAEEKLMREAFGRPYEDYMSQTGQVLPKIGKSAR